MTHWYLSSCLGLLIAWQLRPVCSIVAALPDSRLRLAFMAQMDRVFNEDRHCGRIHDTWLLGRLLRGPLPPYDPPPITGRRHPDTGY